MAKKRKRKFKTRDTGKYSEEWQGMPEYKCVQVDAKEKLLIKFKSTADYEKFKEIAKNYLYGGENFVGGVLLDDMHQAWYPGNIKPSNYIWTDSIKPKLPRFPIYIISKGRYERNLTSEALAMMGVPFFIVVEEFEYEQYKKLFNRLNLDYKNILILPEKYKEEYDTFWKEDDPRTGPGAARNFCWDNAIERGTDWHWVMDDNIRDFIICNNNTQINCDTGTPFYVCEDFILRYKNIGIAGLNYAMFITQNDYVPPFVHNRRIYSCLLIKNDIPYRWRGRYNEDTDLSLRVLKDGLNTVQFNWFTQRKTPTQIQGGGNTAEFYKKEGTYLKSQMLVEMHPDVTKLVERFNRVHHYVDYSKFAKRKLELIEKKTYEPIDEYGLILKEKEEVKSA